LERIYKWMARIGLDAIHAATVDDLDNRAALFGRFVVSQETAQTDPWAERASGRVAAGEFKPMATLPLEMAAE
jgi:nitrite reductase (NADH) large subunit